MNLTFNQEVTANSEHELLALVGSRASGSFSKNDTALDLSYQAELSK